MLTITHVPDAAIGTTRTPISVGPILDIAMPIGHYLAPLPKPFGTELQMFIGDGEPATAQIHRVSGKPLLLFRYCPDVARLHDWLTARHQMLFDLPFSREARAGTCRICGCTMVTACPCGCWWADSSETLCIQHDKSRPRRA
jgi:hypothetical protein